MEIRGIGILEETDETKDIPVNIRIFTNTMQNHINAIVKSETDEKEIGELLSEYLKYMKDKHFSLFINYDVRIEKLMDEFNNIYFEIVLIEKEKNE